MVIVKQFSGLADTLFPLLSGEWRGDVVEDFSDAYTPALTRESAVVEATRRSEGARLVVFEDPSSEAAEDFERLAEKNGRALPKNFSSEK